MRWTIVEPICWTRIIVYDSGEVEGSVVVEDATSTRSRSTRQIDRDKSWLISILMVVGPDRPDDGRIICLQGDG